MGVRYFIFGILYNIIWFGVISPLNKYEFPFLSSLGELMFDKFLIVFLLLPIVHIYILSSIGLYYFRNSERKGFVVAACF